MPFISEDKALIKNSYQFKEYCSRWTCVTAATCRIQHVNVERLHVNSVDRLLDFSRHDILVVLCGRLLLHPAHLSAGSSMEEAGRRRGHGAYTENLRVGNRR